MAFQEAPNINDNEDLSAHHSQALEAIRVLLLRWRFKMSNADLDEFDKMITHIKAAQTINHRLRKRLAEERARADGRRKTHPLTPEEQDYG